MTTVTHTIQAQDGPVNVEAQPATPGLYVYQQADTVDVGAACRWRLGHHSGLALARFSTAEQAHTVAAALADWTDWTGDAEALRAKHLREHRDQAALDEYYRLITDAGGHIDKCHWHGCD